MYFLITCLWSYGPLMAVPWYTRQLEHARHGLKSRMDRPPVARIDYIRLRGNELSLENLYKPACMSA